MGVGATCEKCKHTDDHDKSEIVNTGTIFHPIWAVKCHSCGFLIKSDHGKKEFLDDALFFLKKDGSIGFGSTNRQNVIERAKIGDIKERWVQEYVAENYKKMGFSKIEGPFDGGPDFKGVYKGKKVIIEVERSWNFYLDHNHDKDSNYRDVNVLIVLTPHEAPKEFKKKLPETIIHINIDDFVKWRHPKAKDFAEQMIVKGRLKLIADEFNKRWVEDCSDKDRDMAICPECDICPYFNEGIAYEATQFFNEMALKFIEKNEYPIYKRDFKISDIDPSQIDKSYKEKFKL